MQDSNENQKGALTPKGEHEENIELRFVLIDKQQEIERLRAELAEAKREMERRGQAIADAMGRYRGMIELIYLRSNKLANEHYDAQARIAELEKVRDAAEKTLNSNLHLADGPKCTLGSLRDALAALKGVGVFYLTRKL